MTQEEIQDYNKMCAEFLGWELFKAKSACYWDDGVFLEYNELDDVYVEDPTQEFKKHLILSNPEQVGLEYDFKLFKDYHFKSTLKFHSDWNWIMEVVKKIKTEISIGEHKCVMCPEEQSWDYQSFIEDNVANRILRLTIFCGKKTVIQAINQFLIFYKKNGKSN